MILFLYLSLEYLAIPFRLTENSLREAELKKFEPRLFSPEKVEQNFVNKWVSTPYEQEEKKEWYREDLVL